MHHVVDVGGAETLQQSLQGMRNLLRWETYREGRHVGLLSRILPTRCRIIQRPLREESCVRPSIAQRLTKAGCMPVQTAAVRSTGRLAVVGVATGADAALDLFQVSAS